jgi:hypothetical protein
MFPFLYRKHGARAESDLSGRRSHSSFDGGHLAATPFPGQKETLILQFLLDYD